MPINIYDPKAIEEARRSKDYDQRASDLEIQLVAAYGKGTGYCIRDTANNDMVAYWCDWESNPFEVLIRGKVVTIAWKKSRLVIRQWNPIDDIVSGDDFLTMALIIKWALTDPLAIVHMMLIGTLSTGVKHFT